MSNDPILGQQGPIESVPIDCNKCGQTGGRLYDEKRDGHHDHVCGQCGRELPVSKGNFNGDILG